MVRFVGGAGGADMLGWDLTGLGDAYPLEETTTEAIFYDSFDDETYVFNGVNFTYNSGQPSGGVIKSFQLQTHGEVNFTITGLRLKVVDLQHFVETQDYQGLMHQVLAGDDVFRGGTSSDSLFALDGNDTVNGAQGDDTLIGGSGADRLVGGSGADTFLFESLDDSRNAAADTIADLKRNDVIDLSRIDADTGRAGDQHFHKVDAFTHHAGELLMVYDAGHDRTALRLDVDGDARADATIFLTGDQTAFHHFVY